MEFYFIFKVGFMSGALMSMFAMVMHKIGFSRMNMVAYLGGLLTKKSSGIISFMMGMFTHFMLSVLVAYMYFFALTYFWSAITWQHGMTLALGHWVASGALLPCVDAVNSAVKTQQVSALGYFAQDYGMGAVITFFIGHVIYGTSIGFFLS